jgi:hypothetical protein
MGMTKQLIIVVHGVGVKEAGVSADLLATALDDTPEENTTLTRSDLEVSRLRPHSSDDFHLRENAQYNSGGLRQVFPARIRRYRHNENNEGKLLEERVVADFYWGDISNIASGFAGLLLGIWKTILGLSHIIRENAFSVFPGNGWYEWGMRRIANLAALTIHGPIAAINIILLMGVFINFGLGRIGLPESTIAIWATGIISAVIGLNFSRNSEVFLTRLFGGWMVVSALIFLTLWKIFPEPGIGLSAIGGISDASIMEQACSVASARDQCKSAINGIYLQGLRLVTIMGYLFVIVILSSAILSIAELVRHLKNPHKIPPSIVAPSISLMTLLWIVVISIIWAVISSAAGDIIPPSIPLQGILGALVYCVAGLVAIAIGALLAFIRTKLWAKNFEPSQYIDPENKNVADNLGNKNRMITSSFILWPLRGFLAVLTLFAIGATAKLYGWNLPGGRITASITNINSDTFSAIMLALTAIGGLAVAAGQKPLRAGLGIAIDVITWLNDHSWDSAERGQTGTRTLFERGLPKLFSAKSGTNQQGYWRRERIKQRLEVLTTQLIKDEHPNRLIIVSHSQGTVVAIDVLNTHGRDWLSLMPEGSTISLATMGSPYTHVHHEYFPRAFAAISAMPNLAPVKNGGILTDWINIFRIDDFVGTHIDPTGQWPREHPVHANGHTYYWIDENVFPILKKFVSKI